MRSSDAGGEMENGDGTGVGRTQRISDAESGATTPVVAMTLANFERREGKGGEDRTDLTANQKLKWFIYIWTPFQKRKAAFRVQTFTLVSSRDPCPFLPESESNPSLQTSKAQTVTLASTTAIVFVVVAFVVVFVSPSSSSSHRRRLRLPFVAFVFVCHSALWSPSSSSPLWSPSPSSARCRSVLSARVVSFLRRDSTAVLVRGVAVEHTRRTISATLVHRATTVRSTSVLVAIHRGTDLGAIASLRRATTDPHFLVDAVGSAVAEFVLLLHFTLHLASRRSSRGLPRRLTQVLSLGSSSPAAEATPGVVACFMPLVGSSSGFCSPSSGFCSSSSPWTVTTFLLISRPLPSRLASPLHGLSLSCFHEATDQDGRFLALSISPSHKAAAAVVSQCSAVKKIHVSEWQRDQINKTEVAYSLMDIVLSPWVNKSVITQGYAVMTSEDSCSLCVPIHKFNGYGVWGPMTKELRPKFDAFTFQVNSQFGFHIPEIQI
ncbi:hypothetical protein AHAS_Ahas02G0072800 [Arachis hypogaea]